MDIDKLVNAWKFWNRDKAVERAKAATFRQVMDMANHSEDGFKKEPAEDQMSLIQKVRKAARRVNYKVYSDEVADGLRDRFGRKADDMTVDEIVQYIDAGDWGYGPI
jgi:hypothetical protein